MCLTICFTRANHEAGITFADPFGTCLGGAEGAFVIQPRIRIRGPSWVCDPFGPLWEAPELVISGRPAKSGIPGIDDFGSGQTGP